MEAGAPTFDGVFTEVYLPRISLSEKGGYIWVDKEREVLMSVSMFAELRASLLSAHGDRGPTILFDLGFLAGSRWATNDRNKEKIEGVREIGDAYFLAAQIIGLGGHGELRFASDSFLENNIREICFDIYSSSEVEAQNLVTPNRTKCCWILSGFLSGYMSLLFSEKIIFKEAFCRAEGHRVCHMVGRTAGKIKAHSHNRSHSFASLHGPLQAVPNSTPSASSTSIIEQEISDSSIVGRSSGIMSALDNLNKIAPTNATVLIVGESGVGKELFARLLHERSPRRAASLIAVNCGALPETLIEAELFGVEKGAYSGAESSRKGRFERAQGGTLFLDEVNSLSASAQVKLLRALQGGEIERLGGDKTIVVDTRIVCASNVDLRDAVASGEFRKDLYFRLSTFTLVIPPLRERREDIPMLVGHYLKFYAKKYGKRVKDVAEDAHRELMNYEYPGNVRELSAIIERAVVLMDNKETLEIGDISNIFATTGSRSVNLIDNKKKNPSQQGLARGGNGPNDLIQDLIDQGITIDEISSSMISLALKKTNGNITKASKLIGMSRRQLSYFVNNN